MDKLTDFLFGLFINHSEGMFLYVGGLITITAVNIFYRKEWDEGAKGDNKQWDMPEQMFVIFVRWIIPNMTVAAYCLPDVVSVSDALLFFMSGFALYALTGRWGLEWLSVMRGATITKTESTKEAIKSTESKETITNENKDS